VSVNSQTGIVVLDADDIDDSATTNKFTTQAEIDKLAGIQAGAEVNVNADWNSTSGDSLILNKPTDLTDLSLHSVTELNDVTSAGSGQIITNAERTNLSNQSGVNTGDQNAIDVPYDNSTSGLVATNVQKAIDEVYNVALAASTSGGVTSVFGRTGAVVAQTGDYTASQVTNAFDKTVDTTDNITEGSTNLFHTNADWNATSGKAEILNKPTDITDLSLHSVTELNDVTSTGSGAIITSSERVNLNNQSGTNSGDQNAIDVPYDNTNSGLTATDVQNAIDEVYTAATSGGSGAVDSVFGRTGVVVAQTSDYDAIQVDYDNSGSGLTATDVNAAIDEVYSVALGNTSGNGSTVSSVFGRTGIVVAENGDYTAAQVTNAFDKTIDTTDDIVEGGTNFFVNATQLNIINNQSGTNSGDQIALTVSYDNTNSGLTATDVQNAIDEVYIAATSGANLVDSVFGRTGDVVAENGDYTAAQVTNAFDKTVNTTDDIVEGGTNFFHVNSDWNATSGKAEILNKPTDITDLSLHSVTELNDVTNAGSGQIITTTERNNLNLNTTHRQTTSGNPHNVQAIEIPYDNFTSGLAATDVQNAIDEGLSILKRDMPSVQTRRTSVYKP
jgi:hypothetical protein